MQNTITVREWLKTRGTLHAVPAKRTFTRIPHRPRLFVCVKNTPQKEASHVA